jgi:hypothetical protein
VAASVRGTESDGDLGILRIDFPRGAGEDAFDHVAWKDWFEKFEEQDLASLHQVHKADGEDSTFFKLVRRSTSSGRG